jgi:ribonuclease HI
LDILYNYKLCEIIRFHHAIEKQTPWSSLSPPWETVPGFEIYNLQFPQNSNATIFTDGSKTDAGVGAAFAVWTTSPFESDPEHHTCYSLHKQCTVFQAEVLALLKCSQWILNSPTSINTITVLSDSMSALTAITTLSNFSNLVSKCRENFIRIHKSRNLRLGWIRGHSGIQGNEIVDQYAKEACTILPYSFTDIPKCSIRRKLQQNLHCQWQKMWDEGSTGRYTHQFLPKVSRQFTTPSRYVTYLITGHAPINSYFSRFNITSNENCVTCGTPDTSDHILYTCLLPSRDMARSKLIQAVLCEGMQWPCAKDNLFSPLLIQEFVKFCRNVFTN